MRRYLLVAAAIVLSPTAALATSVSDPVGDFAPGYLGGAADLDVTSFSVTYNPTTQFFSLAATFAGPILPATPGVYVIGVNTGTGTSAPFGPLGAPNVRFNTNFRVNKDGKTTLAGVTATVIGNGFTLSAPSSLFTTTGFSPERYGFNLWPRDGLGAGTFVTDFAPNDGTIAAAPEPGSWALMILGFGLAGTAMRRQRGTAATDGLPTTA